MLVKTLNISDIKIGKRFRKELGDLKFLADTIEEHELLQPIGVHPKSNLLLFGLRRLEAFKKLGRTTIDAVMTTCERAELIENSARKDLEIEEQLKLAEAIYKNEKSQGKRTDLLVNAGSQDKPKGMKTREFAAKKAGFKSSSSWKAAEKILDSKDNLLKKSFLNKSINGTQGLQCLSLSPKLRKEIITANTIDIRKLRDSLKIEKKNNESKKISEIKSSLPSIGERYTLFSKDMNSLTHNDVKDNSVDTMITHCPYSKNEVVFRDLAKLASRVLKDGGLCVVAINPDQVGTLYNHMLKDLKEFSSGNIYNPIKTSIDKKTGVMNNNQHLAIFYKGEKAPKFSENTSMIIVEEMDREETLHKTGVQQKLSTAEDLVKKFSKIGDTVFDPLLGTGTTGVASLKLDRKFIGCEIDSDLINLSKTRFEEEVFEPRKLIKSHESKIEIYNKDTLKVLDDMIKSGKKVDCVITDPPYLMDYDHKLFNTIKGDKNNKKNENLISEYFKKVKKIMKKDTAIYSFCSQHNVEFFKREFKKHFKSKNLIIWAKGEHGQGDCKAGYGNSHELVLFGHKGRPLNKGKRMSDVILCKRANVNEMVHSTEKPTKLLKKFIRNNTKVGDVVFDGFMGSGTTGLACKELGRDFIGVELDKNYFETAEMRLID